jgi:hypothetical protein
MNKTLATLLVIGGAGLLLGVILLAWGISSYNSQASLKNLYEMKIKDNSSEFDNMWKKISQVCQLADSKKEAFREIFVSNSEARTPEGAGKMMLWVKEAAPNLDLKVYDNAQNVIVASRDAWTMRQKESIDIAREYNQNMVTFPKNVFLGMFGFQKIDPKVITSGRTEKAFETGKDDDVSLTPKK